MVCYSHIKKFRKAEICSTLYVAQNSIAKLSSSSSPVELSTALILIISTQPPDGPAEL